MNITIQSVKFDAAEQLKCFIEQKVSKLDVFFRITSYNVCYTKLLRRVLTRVASFVWILS